MLRAVEKYSPVVCGAIFSAITFLNLSKWTVFLSAQGRTLENIVPPIFDIAGIAASSLFAIYVLALSRQGGFIGKIFGTKTFREFHSYVSTSLVLSVAVTFWSAFYLIFGVAADGGYAHLVVVSIWAGFVVWSFVALGRTILIFMVLASAGQKEKMKKNLGLAA